MVSGQEAIALKVSFKRIYIYSFERNYILRFRAGSGYKAASSWLSFLINSDEGENFLTKIDNEKKRKVGFSFSVICYFIDPWGNVYMFLHRERAIFSVLQIVQIFRLRAQLCQQCVLQRTAKCASSVYVM